MCVNSSRLSSQSVSQSHSIWRPNSSLLEGTDWTQRNHHTVWGTTTRSRGNNNCWISKSITKLSLKGIYSVYNPCVCSLPIHRSTTVGCVRLTPRCLSSGRGLQCLCPPTPPITCSLSSTQASPTSSSSAPPPPKGSALRPRSTWLLIFQVGNTFEWLFVTFR